MLRCKLHLICFVCRGVFVRFKPCGGLWMMCSGDHGGAKCRREIGVADEWIDCYGNTYYI